MSRTAVYTGTFDPPTLGHLDIIARAAQLFDRLVVGVGTQAGKQPLFDPAERLQILRREVGAVPGTIEVKAFEGLAVDFAEAEDATALVRGLRGPGDLAFEQAMAGMNGTMKPLIDTVFLVARPALAAIASSLVKDVARGRGDVAKFVTAGVAADIAARI